MTPPSAPTQPTGPTPRALALPLSPVWLTYVLLGVIGAVFLAQFALAPFEGDADPIMLWGAKINSLIVRGQVWRLVTPIFIHASLTHFLFNAYALYVFGRSIEMAYGAIRLFLLFFFAGLGGTIASLWLNTAASVGASGAIFGLFAAEAVLLWRNRGLLGPRAQARFRELLILAGVNLLIGVVPGANIDLWAHIGGALAGAVIAAWIGPLWQVVGPDQPFGAPFINDAQPFNLVRMLGVVALYGALLAAAAGYIALAWLMA